MHQLTEEALEICKNFAEIRRAIALALGCSEGSINRYIRENNDILTKYSALEILAHSTGISVYELVVPIPGTLKFIGSLLPSSGQNNKSKTKNNLRKV